MSAVRVLKVALWSGNLHQSDSGKAAAKAAKKLQLFRSLHQCGKIGIYIVEIVC
jgi:hypothetical protein